MNKYWIITIEMQN